MISEVRQSVSKSCDVIKNRHLESRIGNPNKEAEDRARESARPHAITRGGAEERARAVRSNERGGANEGARWSDGDTSQGWSE